MKQNVLQHVISFILKYIWIFCALLIVLEFASVTYTSTLLMQQSSLGIMQSVSGDISSRVDGVLRLLTGMASDDRFADTSKPLFDRVTQATPYQESYNLYMIALTDKDVNVVSADEKEPPTTNVSLAYRDYMKRLYATGEYQITDAFLSGDGKDIMNYTIAVPITKDGTVEGSVFGSIYFTDIEDILYQQSQNNGRDFYLLGADNTIMAGNDHTIHSESFLDLSKNSHFLQGDAESINRSMQSGASGNFWEFDENGLTYVMYQRVAPTHWTILYRVQFSSVFSKLIPVLCAKIVFYILMCAALYFLGRKYLNRHLAQVNHLLNRMSTMQKELFQSEQFDYDNLLELTQQGLTDQLTGLSTRAI
ncbi:MAG: cache domain-containing protein, partial [Eubacterium sp.]